MSEIKEKIYKEIYSVNTLSVLMAMVLSVVYLISTIGFQQLDNFKIIVALSISWFLLLFPGVITIFLDKYTKINTELIIFSEETLTTITLLILILAGVIVNILAIDLYLFFCILGLLCLIVFYKTRIRINIRQRILFILFSTWIAFEIWGSGYLDPLFIERLSIENVHMDSLFHMSIANMIKTYALPSTGLDYYPYIPYHFGSHWIFAYLSSLFKIHIVDFYNIIYPIVFLPLLFKVIFLFIIKTCENHACFNINKYFVVIFSVFIGVIPFFLMKKITVLSNSSLLSESYNVSQIFFYLFLSIAVSLKREDPATLKFYKNNKALLFILFMLIILIGLSKISLLYLLYLLLFYFFFRLKYYKTIFNILVLVIITILTFILYKITAYPVSTEINILYTYKEYINEKYILLFCIIYYIFFIIYTFLILKKNKGKNVLTVIRSQITIKYEICIVLVFGGLLPVIFLEIPGGSALYFSDISQWVCLIMLTSQLNWEKINISRIKMKSKKVVVVLLIIIFSSSVVINYLYSFAEFTMRNYYTRNMIFFQNEDTKLTSGEFIKNLTRKSYTENINNLKLCFSNNVQKEIERNESYKLLKVFLSIDEFSTSVKKNMYINVPKSNTLYWNLNTKNRFLIWKKATPFILPAFTGVCMIDGIPEAIPEYLTKEEFILLKEYYKEYDLNEIYEYNGERFDRKINNILNEKKSIVDTIVDTHNEYYTQYGYDIYKKLEKKIFNSDLIEVNLSKIGIQGQELEEIKVLMKKK